MTEEEQLERRFEYLKELTIEERQKTLEEIEEEVERLIITIDDDKARSDIRSEARSDLKYERDKLTYLNKITPSKKKKQ